MTWEWTGRHGRPATRRPLSLEIIMAAALTFQIHREPVGKRITASIMLADDKDAEVAGR